jgi:hypothetical protein
MPPFASASAASTPAAASVASSASALDDILPRRTTPRAYLSRTSGFVLSLFWA